MAQQWYELGPFTVFDLETTGMRAKSDRIVEIAALRIDTDGTRSKFETLLNPECLIPYQVSRIHHITDEMVSGAPCFCEIAGDFLEFIAGSTLVAHNARFDLSFLQESLVRSAFEPWSGKTLCTLILMRKVFAGLPSYKLQELRRTFQLDDSFEEMQAHRAGADVEWTSQILAIAIRELLRLQK